MNMSDQFFRIDVSLNRCRGESGGVVRSGSGRGRVEEVTDVFRAGKSSELGWDGVVESVFVRNDENWNMTIGRD